MGTTSGGGNPAAFMCSESKGHPSLDWPDARHHDTRRGKERLAEGTGRPATRVQLVNWCKASWTPKMHILDYFCFY